MPTNASIETARLPAGSAPSWEPLFPPSLVHNIEAERVRQSAAALAEAEQERNEAQEIRLNAERQAQALVEQGRQTQMGAVRQSDFIRLDAQLLGAEQVLYPQPGDEITLKFAAHIQCQAGEFGETAIASPIDRRIAPREVRNLATCYPNPETAAGAPIGEAGEWPVAFFKLD